MPARPLTHDLLTRRARRRSGPSCTQIRITELRDGVFYAELVFAGGVEVSARPSDAIALALRTGTPIFGAEEVLDEAGIAIPDEQEDEVEQFREFLDQISPGGLRRRRLALKAARRPAPRTSRSPKPQLRLEVALPSITG